MATRQQQSASRREVNDVSIIVGLHRLVGPTLAGRNSPMHLKPLTWLLLIAVGCCLCAGGRQFIQKSPDEIDKYLIEHPDLPATDKECLEDSRFQIGVRQETVLFLLGEPARKETVKQPWAVQEKWIYKANGEKIFIFEDQHVVGILENK